MDLPNINRRKLLVAMGSSAAALASGCASPLQQPRSVVSEGAPGVGERIDRVTWGTNDSSLSFVQTQGFEKWLSAQLHAQGTPVLPPNVQAHIDEMSISRESMEALVLRLEDRRKTADASVGDDAKKAAQQAYQQELNRLAREGASRHVLRALYSPAQVRERMAWFWLNHFSVHQNKHNLRAMLGDYEDTIRSKSLGRFRDLLAGVAAHPAMLRYLDNDQNASGRINENYARELMELHTLGVDAGYSQHEVQELARVLTGVGVNLGAPPPAVRKELQGHYVRRGLFEFNPSRHDFAAKQLLGQPIAARGLAEFDEALDRLARHPACARFICRKLAAYWMSDAPPAHITAAMERTFLQTDGQVAQVLQTLFASPEFWQARKFKDPMHYVISAVRAAYDTRPVISTAPVLNWLSRLGESLYGRQTPDGYPLDSGAWSSAGQMATRFEIARSIGSGSAGLFRSDDPVPREEPAFPQLATPVYYEWRAGTLSAATREALTRSSSPQEWNTFLLASPEFMQS